MSLVPTEQAFKSFSALASRLRPVDLTDAGALKKKFPKLERLPDETVRAVGPYIAAASFAASLFHFIGAATRILPQHGRRVAKRVYKTQRAGAQAHVCVDNG
jgi:hypothetical protein